MSQHDARTSETAEVYLWRSHFGLIEKGKEFTTLAAFLTRHNPGFLAYCLDDGEAGKARLQQAEAQLIALGAHFALAHEDGTGEGPGLRFHHVVLFLWDRMAGEQPAS